ncbi:uncharacterized protein LACBIDRAFT_314064 [Laccaria bicolor S238N-H82]|uniref:Predicted protein n=1 Tax=Laccaria bicolor (strain S238N-H82 / ATCC MYA-4686) TaxID=486041 RepID=B0D1H8_LACBS|nr:uncharacterized protein LACBIDRAFT_314064 [Laccaria bicolor S238N-H82]EDR11640.1 predicted protein [Laccaria bicolor S238N-H82]|eukprot:XP_001877537.1 predicted protein [Laccaria bicolor S238N-H82]
MPSERNSSARPTSTNSPAQPANVTASAIVPHVSTISPLPEVIVLYGGRKRTYAQDVLIVLKFEQLIDLLQEDFGVYDPQPTRLPRRQVFHLTQRDHAVPLMVDANSWTELSKNVAMIEIEKPKAKHTLLYILLAICLFLLFYLFFTEPGKPAEHLWGGYRF